MNDVLNLAKVADEYYKLTKEAGVTEVPVPGMSIHTQDKIVRALKTELTESLGPIGGGRLYDAIIESLIETHIMDVIKHKLMSKKRASVKQANKSGLEDLWLHTGDEIIPDEYDLDIDQIKREDEKEQQKEKEDKVKPGLEDLWLHTGDEVIPDEE